MRKKINKVEPKKMGGIGVVNLATYTSPKVVEVRNQEWVNYGEDNNYFGYFHRLKIGIDCVRLKVERVL